MEGLGISNGADLRDKSFEFLREQFGKSGEYFYWVSRGVDGRAVHNDRVRKSVGAENTFDADLWTFEEAAAALDPIAEKVARHCEGKGLGGRTVTLKVKYADFEQITRSRSVPTSIGTKAEIINEAKSLLEQIFPLKRGIRLLGVTLSALGEPVAAQMSFSL